MPFILEPGDDAEAIAEDSELSESEKIAALVEHFGYTRESAIAYLAE